MTRFSCYAESVLKNVTITLPEEVAHWARCKAAEENTSVSKLVGRMLVEQMRKADEYRKAHERWRKLAKPVKGLDATHRISREEAHKRR